MTAQHWPCPQWCTDPHDPTDPLPHSRRLGAVSVLQDARTRHAGGVVTVEYGRPYAAVHLDPFGTLDVAQLRELAADLCAAAAVLEEAEQA